MWVAVIERGIWYPYLPPGDKMNQLDDSEFELGYDTGAEHAVKGITEKFQKPANNKFHSKFAEGYYKGYKDKTQEILKGECNEGK
jgi:hypothetical protein